MISDFEKLRAIESEVLRRRHAYAVLVEQGLMSQGHYEREVAVMKAIAQDYAGRVGERITRDAQALMGAA